jgi:hypothetical protein
MIDFVRESERLLELAGDDEIDVVAKSAGTLLTMARSNAFHSQ